jgi:hypothetical protein
VEQQTAIGLTGDDLTVAEVWAIAVERAPAALSDAARTKMQAARDLVERAAHGSREHTYGVNTGFGRFVNRSIPEELTEELQLRLLRSHACGVGEPYADEIVRAAMLLRANTLAKGNSGARIETVELLLECSTVAYCRSCRAAGRSVRPAISRRSRISLCRSWARARRSWTASACPASRPRPSASSRSARLRRKGSR